MINFPTQPSNSVNNYLLVQNTYQELHDKFVQKDNSNASDSHVELHIYSFHVSEVTTSSCVIVRNNLKNIDFDTLRVWYHFYSQVSNVI